MHDLTKVHDLCFFVHLNKIYLLRSLSKSKVTSALVSSGGVGAGSIATDPGVSSTLVSVHTRQPCGVQGVTGGTLAAEGPVCVDAATSLAHVRTYFAFV